MSRQSSNQDGHPKYRLKVTAGTSYDPSTHVLVPVNASETVHLNSPHMLLSLCVRIRNFTGVPASSPPTAPYFSHPSHLSDQYSISFSFIPRVDIPGNHLIFGNDFDQPIRDRLPPGFNQALRIVKWLIDPGIDGDPYADQPYLYGPALSSWNYLWIGDKIIESGVEEAAGDSNNNNNNVGPDAITNEKSGAAPTMKDNWSNPDADSFHSLVVKEGGSSSSSTPSPSSSPSSHPPSSSSSGSTIRSAHSIPATPSARQRHFLHPPNLDAFTFEKGRLYRSDFGNAYLDFNDFSLKLPGFSINMLKYVDAETHEMRYVLKSRHGGKDGEVYAVVVFSLLWDEEEEN